MQLPNVKGIAPYALGCTSCVYPTTALENIQRIAHAVDDIQLMFFENPRSGNFPKNGELLQIQKILERHNTGCTIHLPTESTQKLLKGDVNGYLKPALQIIDKTLQLCPTSYTIHLAEDGFCPTPEEFIQWRQCCFELVSAIQKRLPARSTLSIENLYYPLEFNETVVKDTGCSYALDIGHLWAKGEEKWEEWTQKMLPQTSVIHLHGYGRRDHESLIHVDEKKLNRLKFFLEKLPFQGVLTCEVFGEKNSYQSLQKVKKVWEK